MGEPQNLSVRCSSSPSVPECYVLAVKLSEAEARPGDALNCLTRYFEEETKFSDVLDFLFAYRKREDASVQKICCALFVHPRMVSAVRNTFGEELSTFVKSNLDRYGHSVVHKTSHKEQDRKL